MNLEGKPSNYIYKGVNWFIEMLEMDHIPKCKSDFKLLEMEYLSPNQTVNFTEINPQYLSNII